MNYNRRSFLKVMGNTFLSLGLSSTQLSAFSKEPDIQKLTILHTNDFHSRIEPFPMDGGRFQGLGGVAKRVTLLEKIRKEEEHIVLLDSGDIFQGTPYFNYFGGELEFKLMSKMKYDVATIGNHDFDAGLEGLNKQLPHLNFPMVNCNYDLSNTILSNKIQDYTILKRGDIKIGVFGVGIELEGLVPGKLYGETQYLDPITKANACALQLKEEEKCDLVICLSHLGYKYKDQQVSDVVLAKESANIDIILGAHTHTFLKEPVTIRNKEEKAVTINQVGWAGILLGRIDVFFEKNTKNKCLTCDNLVVN